MSRKNDDKRQLLHPKRTDEAGYVPSPPRPPVQKPPSPQKKTK